MVKIWKKKIVDLYILKEITYPFLIGIIIIGIIMLSNYLFQLTDLIIVKKVPFALVLKLLFYYLPEIIVRTFPMAILFATITGMGRLSRENEFTALRMGGVSLFRLILPLVILGIIISGVTFVLNENVVPWSSHQARNIIRKTILKESMPDVKENVFFKGPKGRVFYVENYNEDSAKLSKIMIYNRNKNKKDEFPPVITAGEGEIEENKWILNQGIIHEYDQDGHLSIESKFDHMEIEIAKESSQFFGEQRTTSEMSRKELHKEIKLFKKSGIDVSSLYVDYHLKLAKPMAALLFILIGTPLSLNQKDSRIASMLMTISIIFLYYLMLSISRSFGRNGRLPPLLAAWLPNILFAVVGVILILWREKFSNFMHRLVPGLFTVILCLMISVPGTAAGKDSIRIEGEQLNYNKESGIVEMVKNINGKYKNYYFQADKIILKLKDGSEKVLSQPQEIKMEPGSFSGCNYKHPHYFFSAKKIKIYPDDYLEAFHVVFKELSGRLPLFYWPYLYISLKDEEQKIEPEFGYDAQRGWFIKTTWNYKYKKYPGEYYFDFYTKSGSAAGFKQYFLFTGAQKAYISYYEQNDNGVPNLFNKEGVLSYEFDYNNWQFNTQLDYTDYNDRFNIEAIAEGSYEQKNQDLRLDSDYKMVDYREDNDSDKEEINMSVDYSRTLADNLKIYLDYELDSDNYLYSNQNDDKEVDMEFELDKRFKNNLDINMQLNRDLDIEPNEGTTEEDNLELNLDYEWAKYWEMEFNYEYGKKAEPGHPLKTRWGGKGAISREIGDFKAEMLLEREDPKFSDEEENNVSFYRWPEFNLYYQPYSPFTGKLQLGNYFEDDSGIEGYRGGLEGNYKERWQLFSNTSLKTDNSITAFIYSPQEFKYDESNYDKTQFSYHSETTLSNELTDNLRLENKYIYNDFRGQSPFNFDQQKKEETLESNLRYGNKKLELELNGGYNIYMDEYLLLTASLSYIPVPEWELSMNTEYDPNTYLFEDDLTLTSVYKGDRLTSETDIIYNMNSKRTERLSNKIIYELQGDWGWYVENNIEYDYDEPQGERLEAANLVLKKKLHCREISLSYDYLNQEILFTYTIDLFPGQGVTVGQNEDDPFIFNIGDKNITH